MVVGAETPNDGMVGIAAGIADGMVGKAKREYAAETPNDGGEYVGDDSPIYGGIDWAQFEYRAGESAERQKRFEQDNAWRQRNLIALQDLMSGKVDINAIPGVKFRREEGLKALERKASASRYFMSPRMKEELMKRNQDYSSTEFANEFRRRFKMAYAPNWAPRGGQPNPPTLMTLNEKYKNFGDAFGGQTGGRGTPDEGGGGYESRPKPPADQQDIMSGNFGVRDNNGVIDFYDPNADTWIAI